MVDAVRRVTVSPRRHLRRHTVPPTAICAGSAVTSARPPQPARSESRWGRSGAGGALPAGSVKGGVAARKRVTTAVAVADTATQATAGSDPSAPDPPDPRATEA